MGITPEFESRYDEATGNWNIYVTGTMPTEFPIVSFVDCTIPKDAD